MIGGPHICRTVEFLPPDTISLASASAGFKPTKENIITKMDVCLKNLKIGKDDMPVKDLLSNIAFMCTDEAGLPFPAVRPVDDRYSLAVDPPTMTKESLDICGGILAVWRAEQAWS